MTKPTVTNAEIAALIFAQTYKERVDLANYLSIAVRDWIASDGASIEELDAAYFATLLYGWAEEQQPEDPENG